MNQALFIPQGNEKITVELTVKEAMALSSDVRFNQDRKLLAGAKAKVRRSLESKLMTGQEKLSYHALEL